MFILDLVDVCGSVELAHILGIIKNVLGKIQLIGPILGIVGLILALIKLMANPDDKKTKNSIRNWAIAIVMLFLIPVIINLVVGLFDDSFTLAACWKYAGQKNTAGKSNYIDDGKDKTNFFSGSISNNESYSSSGTSTGSTSIAHSTTNNVSKRIFIGDSRTVGMRSAVNSSEDTWSCLESIGLKWMKETQPEAFDCYKKALQNFQKDDLDEWIGYIKKTNKAD